MKSGEDDRGRVNSMTQGSGRVLSKSIGVAMAH